MEFWIGLAVVAGITLYIITIYNKLVALKNRVANAFAQIDVQLQRRYDLIPNLVETAKSYMAHESEVLSAVTQARAGAIEAQKGADEDNISALQAAESSLQKSLLNFNAVAENYPELKADTTMLELMEELTSTENKVGFARQAFNDAAMALNIYRESFPNSLIAGGFNFKEAQMWQVESEQVRAAPKVSFS